jgi:opacity protein-like surface antigen
MRLFVISAAAAVIAGAAFAETISDGGRRLALLRDRDMKEMRLAKADDAPRLERRSRYRESRQAAFVRGGYAFAAGGAGLADGKGAPVFAAGYKTKLSERSDFSFEGELIYQKDKDPVTIGIGVEEATLTAMTALASLRWDGPQFGPVRPYVSGGFGPARVKTKLDDGISPLTDSSIELGYGGRVGVVRPLFRNVDVEAGYRFLGATNDNAANTHTLEIGFSYRF